MCVIFRQSNLEGKKKEKILQVNVIQSGLFEARFDRRLGLLVAH